MLDPSCEPGRDAGLDVAMSGSALALGATPAGPRRRRGLEAGEASGQR